MKFVIRHEIRGRFRVHMMQDRMSYREADILEYVLSKYSFITKVTVHRQTQDVVICYEGGRNRILSLLRDFRYEKAEISESFLENTGRELSEKYKEKLIGQGGTPLWGNSFSAISGQGIFCGAQIYSLPVAGNKNAAKG